MSVRCRFNLEIIDTAHVNIILFIPKLIKEAFPYFVRPLLVAVLGGLLQCNIV